MGGEGECEEAHDRESSLNELCPRLPIYGSSIIFSQGFSILTTPIPHSYIIKFTPINYKITKHAVLWEFY